MALALSIILQSLTPGTRQHKEIFIGGRHAFVQADGEDAGERTWLLLFFCALLEKAGGVRIVSDSDVAEEKSHGCSDGTTTGYMKVETRQILHEFLYQAKHPAEILKIWYWKNPKNQDISGFFGGARPTR
jgi:hypothetical protein